MKRSWKFLVLTSMFMMLIGAVAACGGSTGSAVPVHMGDHLFPQNTVSLHRGESILLINSSSMQHIIENGTWKNQEAHPGAELGAPKVNATIAAGSSQTIGPFTVTGTFHFYCTIHPGMNLNVIVT